MLDEPSLALRRKRGESDDQRRRSNLKATLEDRCDLSALALGRKLHEVWAFASDCSKTQFATLMHISADKIDDYFSGVEMLDLPRIVVATKLFDLPPDFFFRATNGMRFAFWQDDVVKYAILSLVQPKSRIAAIEKSFYVRVVSGLAWAIADLHRVVYRSERAPAAGDELSAIGPARNGAASRATLSKELRNDLARQYYKLLEQYPSEGELEDRALIDGERMLDGWFSCGGPYLARLIVEGIESIEVMDAGQRPRIVYRFEEDIRRGSVSFRGYNEERLMMDDATSR